jgi:hypothetical protein
MIITPENRFDFNQNPPSTLAPDYVISFNERVGSVELTSDDVVEALGYTPSEGSGGPFTIADTTGLQAALDSKALLVHTHVIADVTGLQAALDAKQPVGSYLTAADLTPYATSASVTTGLATKEGSIAAGTVGQYWRGDKSWQTFDKTAVGLGNVDNTADALKNVLTATKLLTARNINGVAFDGSGNITINAVDSTARVPATRLISTTGPITGGGDLSADRTLAISAATTGAAGSMSAADKTKLDAITGTNTGDQTITLTSDVTGTGTGSFATTIANGAVSLAKMANMATASLIYRKTAGAGAPEVNTLATLKTDLGLTGTNSGDQTITLSGDVSGSGTGAITAAIGANKVTRGMMAATTGATLLGATGAGNVADLTAAQAKTFLAIAESDVTNLTTDLAAKAPLASPQFTGVTFYQQVAPTAKTTTGTLTIAELLTLILTVTSATAVSLTLPTGTLSDAGILSGALAVNEAFEWYIINLGSSSGAATLVAGTGHTIVGSAITAISTSSRWLTRKTATNTFVTYRIA